MEALKVGEMINTYKVADVYIMKKVSNLKNYTIQDPKQSEY
jgi:hypothetical protein